MFVLSITSFNLAAANSEDPNDHTFGTTIQPLLQRYCFDCHSGDQTEAEIDLAEFKTVAAVRQRAKTWLKIREMLDSRQMPPKESPQPSDEERTRLQTWVRDFLTAEAEKRAGDPGPVVLRRLNNAEYNYTVRDVTGVATLDPTGEFPVDGAAGEGFINTGSAQAMSPSLVTKYLDAAKSVAAHAVLLPDGIRFSRHQTRRDHTDELLARIQAFYRQFTEDGGGAAVNLQGIQFETNQGGLLPVEKYLAATLEQRDAITSGATSLTEVARQRALNARYLATLWRLLNSDSASDPAVTGAAVPGAKEPSLLLDALREQWRQAAPTDAKKLAAHVEQAQQQLWKFNAVGQLGDQGKQKTWMEGVTPIVGRQELRHAFPPSAAIGSADDAMPDDEFVIYLAADDLGDGNEHDFVVWDRPRIEFAATETDRPHPPILLRDVRPMVARIGKAIASEIPRTAVYLDAVARLQSRATTLDEVANTNHLNPLLLKQWVELVGLGHREKREVRGHFTDKLTRAHGYEAVNGWGSSQTPNMLTNRSAEEIKISTLVVPARGVVMHPSPTEDSFVSWRCPLAGKVQITGLVADADSVCGNGAAWRVELLSEKANVTLASGEFDNGGDQKFDLKDAIEVEPGDILSLFVNARDNSHVCDTTHVELTIAEFGGEKRAWDLASDVVDKIQAANPLPDSYGHGDTWYFGATSSGPSSPSSLIPNSTLAQWRAAVVDARPAGELKRQAESLQRLLQATDTNSLGEPDRQLRKQLLDWKGPLRWTTSSAIVTAPSASEYGLAPQRFGKHPSGGSVDEANLCLQAPSTLELRLPAALVAGAEFVVSGLLHESSGMEGSVQLQVSGSKPDASRLSMSLPFLARQGSSAHRRLEAAMAEFRDLFPAALCYARIVPVDEVVTLTLYFREDVHLQRLMLDDQQAATLDRLWDELLYVAREPIALTVAFEQIYEFATQDRPDLVNAFGPMRKPINERADIFRQRLLRTEPAHVTAMLEFADRAWRRPLNDVEREALRHLYRQLRAAELEHEAAVRLTLARVLTSPEFLYRREVPPPGQTAAPVSSSELANRLSYFLWSSLPDAALRQTADAGKLVADDELLQQTRRMLKDERTRRLAIQFACQWLHLRDFDQNDDKNEKLYPEFASLRGDMYEETVRFFEDMFRNDGSILGLLDADHTYLNENLAKLYGFAGIEGTHWQRVEGVRDRGRGGILGMASLLASQSGASRTSPILRGNWVYETLLGERLPRPPANVPQLPETVPTGLTARQLIERHSSDAACAKCHARIDPFGFALEQYDALGRLRPDPVDTSTRIVDAKSTAGKSIEGLDGLRNYLLNERRDDILRQFCRKLLGFALGREVQLSDELLLVDMQRRLKASDYRFGTAVESIVLSRQFREIRGRDYVDEGM